MSIFSWLRKTPTNAYVCAFIAQVANIPYDSWEIRHKNPEPSKEDEALGRWNSRHPKSPVGYDPRTPDPTAYKLVFETTDCITEFYEDPSSKWFRIHVDGEEIYYGQEAGLRKIWYAIFRFQLLSEEDKRYARAADAIAQAIKTKAEPQIPG